MKQPVMSSMLVLVLVSFISVLAGCGFHLKGTQNQGAYPFNSMQLINNNATHNEVVTNLERQLTASQIALSSVAAKKPEPSNSHAKVVTPQIILELGPTALKRSTTSNNSLGNRTSELLTMSQPFVVFDYLSGDLVSQGTVKVWRDRQIENSARLASENEKRMIERQMRQELADKISARLQRLKLPKSAVQSELIAKPVAESK